MLIAQAKNDEWHNTFLDILDRKEYRIFLDIWILFAGGLGLLFRITNRAGAGEALPFP